MPDEEWEGSELRQAVALAEVLANQVREEGRISPEEPIGEDFGAVLPISVQGGVANITISYYPQESSDFSWAVQFSQRRPLLRLLFGKGDDERVVEPVRDAIRRLVAKHPTRYRNSVWIEESEL